MIGAIAIVAGIGALAYAILAPWPMSRALLRVRLARGAAASGTRERLRELPLLRAWRPVDSETLRLAGLSGMTVTDLALTKVAAALAGAALALALGVPPPVLGLLAFAMFVAPSEWVRRRAAARSAARRDALLPFVERVLALTSSGMTLEHALRRVAETESPLRSVLAEVSARAELGMSPLDALMELATRERFAELRDIARDLLRARHGGRPLLPVLVERREVLRLGRRARRLEAASRVDGALSLVLVLAYLPALLLLVVVPLFLGLLRALGT